MRYTHEEPHTRTHRCLGRNSWRLPLLSVLCTHKRRCVCSAQVRCSYTRFLGDWMRASGHASRSPTGPPPSARREKRGGRSVRKVGPLRTRPAGAAPAAPRICPLEMFITTSEELRVLFARRIPIARAVLLHRPRGLGNTRDHACSRFRKTVPTCSSVPHCLVVILPRVIDMENCSCPRGRRGQPRELVRVLFFCVRFFFCQARSQTKCQHCAAV